MTRTLFSSVLLSSSFAVSLLASCTSSSSATPSGGACPDANAPTYASFGQGFMAKYCTDCHSASSANRHGAPVPLNFDTIDDLRKHADGIDVEAAAGPSATNEDMPDLDAKVTQAPTPAERELLGQFLACVKEGKN